MTLEASFSAPASARTPEEQLVDRLRQGEIAAVGTAYDLHHEAVRRFTRRLLGNEEASEDLVQEVFVALPKAARRFRGDSALRTFLISIAVNLSRRHIRTATRRRAALHKVESEPVSPLHGGSGSAAPDREIERRQLAAALERALDTLSKDHRVAFVLCEVESLTSRDAADIVGVPEGTVRTRVFHAKKKLRKALSREGFA